MRRISYAALGAPFLFLALPAAAQDEGGMIQRFLQDKLSAGGREVKITGFEGLLAGKATLEELTIADDQGVWLTLEDAVLDWSRAAMLRGNLNVQELSAGKLIVERLPVAEPDPNLPTPPKAEASGFALPELPVAIRIDKLSIGRAELGEALMGQAAALALEGAFHLVDGEGDVTLDTRRLDGPDDHISVMGSFQNESRVLSLDLEVREDAGGLVTTLMKLPGAPSVSLDVEGNGPLSDFTADIVLGTDNQERLTGQVTLQGTGDGGTGFAADIGGDITPLLPTDFHDFFGEDIRLTANGTRSADGALDLPEFELSARSIDLVGELNLGADGMPTAFALAGAIADSSGKPVRLPVSGPGSYLDSVQLNAAFDASVNDRWRLLAQIENLALDGVDVGTIGLDGAGTITNADGAAVTADMLFDVLNLALNDAGLSEAIGAELNGGASLAWQQGNALQITRLYVDGDDYALTVLGDASISGRSVQVKGEGRLQAQDLSRFSTLAGKPLTGNATADVSGQGDVLGGQFAVAVNLEGDGLSIGQETADRLLADPVTLSAAARRDTAGTVIDLFELRSRAVTADARGKVGGGSSDLRLDLALTDVGLVLPGREGQLTIAGTAREQAAGDWNVGLDLEGPYDLTGTVGGRVHPGDSDLDLDLSLPDIAPLVPGHSGPVTIKGSAAEASSGAWDVDLDVGGPYDLTAAVNGLIASGASDLNLDIALPDVAPLVPGHTGAVALTGTAAETGTGGWTFKLDGSGPYQAALNLDGTMGGGPGQVTLVAGLPDVAPLVPGLSGPFRAEGTATDAGDGLWQVDFDASGPLDGTASVDGVAGGGKSDLTLAVSLPDLSPLVPQLQGPLKANGTAAEIGDGRWDVDLDVAGPYQATATVAGAVGATGTDVDLTLAVPDISPLAPGFRGGVSARASAAQDDTGNWGLSLDADGPYSSTVKAGGTYGGGASQLTFDAGLPDIGPIVPDLSGPVNVSGTASEAAAGAWDIALNAGLPYNGTAQVDGTVASGATSVNLALNLPSIAPFAPGLTGGVAANGTVSQAGDGYAVNLTTTGPQSASTAIAGTIAGDFSTVDITAKGTAPLGLANRALAPNVIQGNASFDMAVNGTPSLQAVSGTATIRGAELVLPTLRQTLKGINVTAQLAGSAVQLDVSANGQAGGSIGAKGSVELAGALNANLEASLNQFVLTDPELYKTSLDGKVAVTGPLTGGGNIKGRINVGRTEVRVPDGGLGFGGAIPNMTHINEPGNVLLTRTRAGLVKVEKKTSSGGGSAAAPFGLDIIVSAPEQIFIRGRGLDTEMGGAIAIGGTTAFPKPVGEIEVIRGRLDILGQRLEVSDGTVSMAGGLKPYLDLTATSTRDDFEFQALITGPVDDPTFKLTSVPDLPEDEVLARFLFGKSVTDLSALQAVQMANALATLAGRGGPGLLAGARAGLGLDDLDVATTAEGETELRAGKYISDNIYTEFVADSDGTTEIDINIDLTRNFTIKGTADSKGDSSIGVYFERDY